jgi:hypothetical protein
MSYVCLSSPRWSTGADVPADLAASLLGVAPRVAVGEHGLVWGDARGLYVPALAEAMLGVARDYGFENTHAGAALTATAAEVAATQGAAATPGTVPLVVVKAGQDQAFIAPHALAVLHLDERLAALLDGLGIATCGDLAALDAEAVEVRLGAAGVRLWRQARASDQRTLFTSFVRALPSASLDWVEYGLTNPERLQFVINALAGSVCASLAERGERTRELSLVFALGNHTQRAHRIRSTRPSAEQKRWMRLVREELDQLTLDGAVTGVTLRVESVTGNDGAQGDLFDRGFASAPAVASAMVQLTDDQGDVIVAPANTAHPLVETRTRWLRVSEQSVGERQQQYAAQSVDPRLTLQLLADPKVVVVETETRRDHEVPVRYREDDEWHVLADVAGPDRVSGGQWSAPYGREYFRCVREDGLMVWLYHGIERRQQQQQQQAGEGDWFLHGWWD